MKIISISDIHGQLIEIPECDLFIIAGDICPATNHQEHYQENWLRDKFNPWLDVVPARHKVFIAGNHDLIFQKNKGLLPKFNAHYLENSSVTIEGIKIYGSPWTPFFCNWSFNFPQKEKNPEYGYNVARLAATACWDLIPNDTDILVTHGPPKGYGDVTTYGGRNHYGCPELLKAVKRVKPKYHLFGHFHNGYEGGDTIKALNHIDGSTTYCCNCSIVNENYIVTNPPTVLQI